MFEELQKILDAIAGEGTCPPIPDWRATEIKNWRGGIVAEAERISNPEWWRKSSNQAEQSLTDLLKRAGLGSLRTTDGAEKENLWGREKQAGTSVEEIVEHQRDREKVAVHDAEEYEKYLPQPGDNVHRWYSDFAKRINVNTAERRPWFSALGTYISKFTGETKASELDENVVRAIVKMICEEGAA